MGGATGMPRGRRRVTRGGAPLLALLAAGFLAGCAGGDTAADPNASHPGRAVYYVHCVACHGRDGNGAENLFPPLAGSPWVLGSPRVPIRVVLHGMEGRLTVRGATYLNLMPGLGDRLTDRQIADVLSYVRVSFGNDAGPVSAAEVARAREETSGRDRMYKVEEMEAFRAEVAAEDAGPGDAVEGAGDTGAGGGTP